MAFTDDLSKTVDAIDKLSKDGLPIKLEHTVDSPTIWQLVGGMALVAVLFVVLLGIKDVLVKRVS